METYAVDLAYVHDTGFGSFAINAAKMIREILKSKKKGLVIDLGCGSGVIAEKLLEDGFQVLGIDQSKELIKIAEKRAPQAIFRATSFFDTDFPSCTGVISTSECFNYIVEDRDNEPILKQLFQKVFHALESGGIFIFDMLEPGIDEEKKSIVERDDWTMFVHRHVNHKTNLLKREITLFRKIDHSYRKSKETHLARLYPHKQIVSLLQKIGFKVSLFKQYKDMPLDKHHFGFLCEKA